LPSLTHLRRPLTSKLLIFSRPRFFLKKSL
jgi:hypothetical protein